MSALVEEVAEALALPAPERAREILRAAGVPVARLAVELGVHEGTAYRWLSGRREPHGEMRLAYGRLLRELDAVTRAAQERAR